MCKKMSENITEDKTELRCPPEVVIDICDDLGEKNEQDFIQSTKENVIQEPVDATKNEEDSDSDVCIIEEFLGNATTSLSSNDDIIFYDDGGQEPQLIFPKKTDDITKIKGWRRKQFFVEKPTTVEFEELIYPTGKTSSKRLIEEKRRKIRETSPGNIENAFVCDSLDEFLEQDAELKINYKIPHLFAEVGIKLTKEEIASCPNLSETDIKEIEMKYCKTVPMENDVINLDDVKSEKIKKMKRPIEDEKETASFKVVKLEDNNLRLVRVVKKPIEQKTYCLSRDTVAVENESKEKIQKELKLDINCDSEIKLTNKDLGLVVYPCPHKPLHPVVQSHLRKLRSYRTSIDENWANFATSALVRKDSQYKRFILPVKCCMKVVRNAKTFEKASDAEIATEMRNIGVLGGEVKNIQKFDDSPWEVHKMKISEEEIKKMQNCRVVIQNLNNEGRNKPLCVKHSRYNCNECKSRKKLKSILKPIALKQAGENKTYKPSEQNESVVKPSQLGLDEDITSLLSKKLKMFNPDSPTSIDSLKSLNRNTVELIKTKFMQKSFLHEYINIWYLKQKRADMRSRAFLTFSKTPPVPNSINLRSKAVMKGLPKVLLEITDPEKSIDPNEYVLLLCNGKFWEIHGSVNVAFHKTEKSETTKSFEQVMIPTTLPELKKIQDLSFKLLKMKAFKWCVADVTQKFKDIELKTESFYGVISRKKLVDFSKYKTYGFVPMWTSVRRRMFGTYMIESLLPYVLIGPFHLFETPIVTLAGKIVTLPFVYEETNTKGGEDMKRYISSTIKESKETGKTIECLWLHYNAVTDGLCFLEVITKCGVNKSPRSGYSIQEEHGYSLISNAPPPPPLPPSPSPPPIALNQVESIDESSQSEVYVYFDIVSLGYVSGMLEKDNSVTIKHPFDAKTKVKSSEIGNWFLGTIRSRIQFVPINLSVNWFVTKTKSHLKNRQPFNRNFLNGSHVLTNAGIFYIFKFGDSKNQENVLGCQKPSDVLSKDSVIDEVVHLKGLSDLLVKESHTKLNLRKILTVAVNEILMLQQEMYLYQSLKTSLEKEKLKLLNNYLGRVQLMDLDNQLKISLIKKIEDAIFSKNGRLSNLCMKKLNLYPIGQEYLKSIENENFAESSPDKVQKNSDSPKSVDSILQQDKKINEVPNAQKISTAPKAAENDSKSVGNSSTQVKVNKTKDQSNCCDAPLNKTASEKQEKEKISPVIIEEEISRSDLDEKSESSGKNKTFVKLTSDKLPNNIKLRDFGTMKKPISLIVEAKNKNATSYPHTKSVNETNSYTNKKVNGPSFEIVSYCKKTDTEILKSWEKQKIFFSHPKFSLLKGILTVENKNRNFEKT